MELEKIREQAAGILSSLPIRKAYLFGSAARGENKPGSDLDILVETDPEKPMGLIAFIKLQLKLEETFRSKVDLLSSDGLSPYVAPFVHQDMILIYEA